MRPAAPDNISSGFSSQFTQQFQIQGFDSRFSVVAQLRPLTQLNTTIKDNAAKPEIDP
jgi:hypothetical protein